MMDRAESRQIEVMRVFCITTMMWVHVNPGLSLPSFVNGGPMGGVGHVLGDTFGRISVTTLSFISGYLFWKTGVHRPLSDVLRRLAFSIYAPCLVWSGIFIVLALFQGAFLGRSSSAISGLGTRWQDYVSAWTGLLGPTANTSLFFIRDLVVSTVLVRGLAPVIQRWPWLALAGAFLVTVAVPTEPLLFRPSIFFFMVCGAATGSVGLTLPQMSRPTVAVPVGLAAFWVAQVLMADFPESGLLGAFLDLLRRGGMGLIIAALAAVVQRDLVLRNLSEVSRHSYLAYLTHGTVIGVGWFIWKALVGDEMQPSYLVFYLAAPLAVYGGAMRAGRVLDHAPEIAQLLIRGKINRTLPLVPQPVQSSD